MRINMSDECGFLSYGKKNIIKATINNRIVEIDLASNDRNGYDYMKDKITYLGYGLYHSYNGMRAHDKEYTHFWKFKVNNKGK